MVLAGPSELKGVGDDAITAAACEDSLLDRHLKIGVLMQTAAHFGVLALVVLPNNAEVDLTCLAIAEWALDALQQANRSKINVLPECPADGDQQPPE